MFGVLTTLASSIFGGMGITDLIKYAVRLTVMISLLGIVNIFVSKVIGLLPTYTITGCAGYYANAWGMIDAMKLVLSIVVYGFLFKTAYAYASKFI